MNALHSEKLLPRFRPGEFHPRSLDFSGGTVHTARNAKTSPLSPVDRTGLFAIETSQTNRPARHANGVRLQSSDCSRKSGHRSNLLFATRFLRTLSSSVPSKRSSESLWRGTWIVCGMIMDLIVSSIFAAAEVALNRITVQAVDLVPARLFRH